MTLGRARTHLEGRSLRLYLAFCAALGLALSAARPADAQVWPLDNAFFVSSHPGQELGTELLAVDVNNDGRQELIAYKPRSDSSGEVNMYAASADRLFGNADFVDVGTAGDELGFALAAGRFASASPRQQVALGSPGSGDVPFAAGIVLIKGRNDADDGWIPAGSVNAADAGIPDDPEEGDRMGAALAAGDFNGDGTDDLAIGVPGEDLPSGDDVGSVVVVYGAENGLDRFTGELWHQNVTGVPDSNETGDGFGSELAAGDFDGDGFDDLAIGAQAEDVGSTVDAGAVTILYGSNLGLSTVGAQWLTQGDGVVPGEAEQDDFFGQHLAAGALFHDSVDGVDAEAELVIGVPREDFDGELSVGAVIVLVGRAGGFTDAGARLLFQDDLPGAAREAGDRFGASLAIGDFTSDGRQDLAIGTPGEIYQGVASGVAQIVPSGPLAPDLDAAQLVVLDAAYALFPLADDDRFGAGLAAPDFDGDGSADLAVGLPGWEAVVGNQDSGAVQVCFGALFADGFERQDTLAWSSSTL